MKIAIIQPVVPVYREEFYKELGKYTDLDIYVFKDPKIVNKEHTKISSLNVKWLPNVQYHGVQLYNPFPLLCSKYDVIVLMMSLNHVTTLLLLLLKCLHGKKIILWGHGISVKRYMAEEIKPDWKLKWMIGRADGCWIYMDKEYQQWKQIFPQKPIAALNNTVSEVENILKTDVMSDKSVLKRKYGITQGRVAIFCARFTPFRRTDILLKIIGKVNPQNVGFIIIGDGEYKPDFGKFPHVYDFGTVYDNNVKQELFCMADIYLQPGWVGLSIVEAMAYAKPIFTFRRTMETYQCVEYSYICEGENGMIFDRVEDCVDTIQNLKDSELKIMGINARELVRNYLRPSKMASNAFSVIEKVLA